jgi:probable rRNA maturation factor
MQDQLKGEREVLERAARQALLRHEEYPAIEITILLTGDEQMGELNWQYLGLDGTTDVLSFPAGEIDPDTQALYLGDVVLSLPRARLQAEAGGHSLQAELQLLVVHGVLHLMGYDHASSAQKKTMWSLQAEILSQLEAPLLFPPAE